MDFISFDSCQIHHESTHHLFDLLSAFIVSNSLSKVSGLVHAIVSEAEQAYTGRCVVLSGALIAREREVSNEENRAPVSPICLLTYAI